MSNLGNIGAFMVVRNEQQFIERNILYHLRLGIDRISIIDHCSTDATTCILKGLERMPGIIWERCDNPVFDHALLANRALKNLIDSSSPSWVIALDADEFLYFKSGLRNFISDREKNNCQYGTIPWLVSIPTNEPRNNFYDSIEFFKPWPERPWQHQGHFRKAFSKVVPNIQVVVGGHYFTTTDKNSYLPYNPILINQKEAFIAHYEFRDCGEELFAKWQRLAKFECDSSSTSDSPWLERLSTIKSYVEEWNTDPSSVSTFWQSGPKTFWGTPVPANKITRSSAVRDSIQKLNIKFDNRWRK